MRARLKAARSGVALVLITMLVTVPIVLARGLRVRGLAVMLGALGTFFIALARAIRDVCQGLAIALLELPIAFGRLLRAVFRGLAVILSAFGALLVTLARAPRNAYRRFAAAPQAAARRGFALALMPLSMVPFAFVVPGVVSPTPHGRGVRLHGGSGPTPPPNVSLNAAEFKQFTPPPTYSGAIPVLTFHGVNDHQDHYSVSQYSFARDLALLQHLGYHTISIYQYAAWRRGEQVQLPSRPILLTFDDGRFDSWRGADRVLAKYHMQATMFVITGPVVRGNLFYLKWNEIEEMQRSGRWDIQFHANNGHVFIVDDAQGDIGPYYAELEYQNGRQESIAHYITRVQNDVTTGLAIMRRHGYSNLSTMALPYGEYGQADSHSNPAVKKVLAKILDKYFVAQFVQSIHDYTPYSTAKGPPVRYELHTDTTLSGLYGFLLGADPTARRTLPKSELRALTDAAAASFNVTTG